MAASTEAAKPSSPLANGSLMGGGVVAGDPPHQEEQDNAPVSHRNSRSSSSSSSSSSSGMPWWPTPVLACAVLMVSSAGAVMKSVVSAAPIALASWRLQATSLVLLPGFLWQLSLMPTDTRARLKQPGVLALLACCALSLAAHSGFWVYSLDTTSLPHSLLFVSTPPLLLAGLTLLKGEPLTAGEGGATLLGTLGGVVVASSAALAGGGEWEPEVTLVGDLAALLGAVAFVVYVSGGKYLREWMPLYVYAFPVTAGAAAVLAIAAAVQLQLLPHPAAPEPSRASAGLMVPHSSMESSSRVLKNGTNLGISVAPLPLAADQPHPHSVLNPLAWIFPPYLAPTLYLAFGPGFVGHTGLNAVLRFMPPLVVTMAITIEPPLGSLIGWLLGQTAPPGVLTYVGGALLVGATVWVAVAGGDGEELRRRREGPTVMRVEKIDDDAEEGPLEAEELQRLCPGDAK